MNMLARLGYLLKKEYGEWRYTRDSQKKADLQPQFILSKKKKLKRKNIKSWTKEKELKGKAWSLGKRNQELGFLGRNWSLLPEVKDSRLVICLSQKPGPDK